ncbi:MAG TPA: Na+/H+ antiporter subunit E [Marinobacter sp.]|nr:Na+/H+ antiporter subunit E [Marinobacter sp.]
MLSAPASPVIVVVLRSLSLFVVWWVLTLGDASGLGFGIVVSVIVAALSIRLFPPSGYRLRPFGLLLFFRYFLLRSVLAGLDVARRVLAPTLPVNPGEITLSLRLPEGSPRWLLANTLSLMPGTLSVLLDGDQLTLHCLDVSEPVEPDLREAERQIARVFGLQLNSDHGVVL